MIYKSEEIGKIIKAERKKRKMSQEKFGEKLGITGKQISNYEKGVLIPPMETLLDMCNFFHCELGYILGEKDYSQRTKLNTIISDEMGLNIEAINAIIRITGKERSCIDWGYESNKYRRILNYLLTTKEFPNFIKALAKLDESYQKKEQEKKIFDQLYDELGESLFNKAMEWRDVVPDDEGSSDLTPEECDAINKVNTALDQCFELDCEFEQEMKSYRFSLLEVFILMLNDMYPNSN